LLKAAILKIYYIIVPNKNTRAESANCIILPVF